MEAEKENKMRRTSKMNSRSQNGKEPSANTVRRTRTLIFSFLNRFPLLFYFISLFFIFFPLHQDFFSYFVSIVKKKKSSRQLAAIFFLFFYFFGDFLFSPLFLFLFFRFRFKKKKKIKIATVIYFFIVSMKIPPGVVPIVDHLLKRDPLIFVSTFFFPCNLSTAFERPRTSFQVQHAF